MRITVVSQDAGDIGKSKKGKEAKARKTKPAPGRGFRRTSGSSAVDVEQEAKKSRSVKRIVEEEDSFTSMNPEETFGSPASEQAQEEAMTAFVPPTEQDSDAEPSTTSTETGVAETDSTTQGVGESPWPAEDAEGPLEISPDLSDMENTGTQSAKDADAPTAEEPMASEESEEEPEEEPAERPRRSGLKLEKKQREKKTPAKKTPSKKSKSVGKKRRAVDKVFEDEDNYAEGDDVFQEDDVVVAKAKASPVSIVIIVVETLVAGCIFAVLGNQVGTIMLNTIVTRTLGG